MNRDEVEALGRRYAGATDENDKWIWCRVLGDINMWVMKGDRSVSPWLESDGFWESWVTTWVFNNVKPGTVFWDIGANTGYYGLLAWSLGATVSAFEPNPEYFEMLYETLRRNSIGFGTFRLYNCALSDKDGTATLYVPAELQGSASLSEIDPKWKVHRVEVTTRRLDGWISGFPPHDEYVIKMDAEGAEEKIWDGMVSLLNSAKNKPTVLMEYTPGAYSDEFFDKLKSYGSITTINHQGGEDTINEEWLKAQTDWVMLVIRGR